MRTLSCFVLSLAACVVQAAAPAALEYSVGIAGEVVIDPHGRVQSWRMDDGLAPVLAALVQRNVEQWRFEPILVDGKPVAARTRMRLSLLAQPRDGGDYALSVDQVFFGDMKQRKVQAPPQIPRNFIKDGIEARVIVLARLDAQGNVVQVHPYQTSLSRKGAVARWRSAFEKASLEAVAQWKFEPGEEIDGQVSANTVKVPITYLVASGSSRAELAKDMKRWRAFIPGPVSPAPWPGAEAVDAVDDAALEDGQAVALVSRFRLQSDVVGKSL